MKKELIISFLLACISIIWIILLIVNTPNNSSSSTSLQTPSQIQITQQPLPQTTSQTMTLSVVKTHNSANDCWIIIENKVYDVTQYLTDHPGGARTIIPTCGTDATRVYNTKNRNQPHSSYANQLLQDYYVGDLK